MNCTNVLFQSLFCWKLYFTVITIKYDSFMFWLYMLYQHLLILASIITFLTTELNTFMLCLFMSFQITLICTLMITLITIHRGLEQDLGLTNWTKRSDTVRVTRATVGTTPNVQSNPRILVFWKKSFFSFFGAQKVHFLRFLGVLTNLFDPHTFLASKLMVLRGSVF